MLLALEEEAALEIHPEVLEVLESLPELKLQSHAGASTWSLERLDALTAEVRDLIMARVGAAWSPAAAAATRGWSAHAGPAGAQGECMPAGLQGRLDACASAVPMHASDHQAQEGASPGPAGALGRPASQAPGDPAANPAGFLQLPSGLFAAFPGEVVAAINEVLYTRHGYAPCNRWGNIRDAQLSRVLEGGMGCSPALSVLYLVVAQKLGIRMAVSLSLESGRYLVLWPVDEDGVSPLLLPELPAPGTRKDRPDPAASSGPQSNCDGMAGGSSVGMSAESGSSAASTGIEGGSNISRAHGALQGKKTSSMQDGTVQQDGAAAAGAANDGPETAADSAAQASSSKKLGWGNKPSSSSPSSSSGLQGGAGWLPSTGESADGHGGSRDGPGERCRPEHGAGPPKGDASSRGGSSNGGCMNRRLVVEGEGTQPGAIVGSEHVSVQGAGVCIGRPGGEVKSTHPGRPNMKHCVIDPYGCGGLLTLEEVCELFEVEPEVLLQPATQRQVLAALLARLIDAFFARAAGCSASPISMMPLSIEAALDRSGAQLISGGVGLHALSRALAAAEKRMALLPGDSDAQLKVALLHYYNRSFDDAYLELGTALERNKEEGMLEKGGLLLEKIRLELMFKEDRL